MPTSSRPNRATASGARRNTGTPANRPKNSPATTAAAATACALVALLSGGCYERVVETRGIGASGTSTYEPTQPTVLDRLMDGPNRNSDSQRRYRSN